jgi:hypothetical protein
MGRSTFDVHRFGREISGGPGLEWRGVFRPFCMAKSWDNDDTLRLAGDEKGNRLEYAVWSRRRMGWRFLPSPPKCQGNWDQTGAIVLFYYP